MGGGNFGGYSVPELEPGSEESAFSIYKGSFAGATHQFVSMECALDQLESSLLEIERLSAIPGTPEIPLAVLKITVFISRPEFLAGVRRIIGRQSWLNSGAVELVLQKPASGAQVGMQVWQTSAACTNPPADDLFAIKHPGNVSWTFEGTHSLFDENLDLEEWFDNSWDRTNKTFAARGFAATNVVRTWLYIGDINGRANGDENYQRINKARNRLFSKHRDTFVREDFNYPASTGIGQQKGLFVMGTLGCRILPPARIVSVENQRQVSAYNYPSSESKFPPLFSRAVAVLDKGQAFVMVSGTASITGARSVHLNSVEKQTEQTINNIEEVLETAALTAKGGIKGLQSLKSCIVYIKHEKDYAAVRRICRKRLPAAAVINYCIADICRQELLVEIEGIAILADAIAS